MNNHFNPYSTPSGAKIPDQFQLMTKPNYFELFAFGFSIASLFSCSVFYTAYMFAGLAIMFALLSRGAQMKFSPKAKWSIILGVAGIVLSTILFVASFLFLLEEYGSIEGILRAGSEMMGIDFEKEFGELFQE